MRKLTFPSTPLSLSFFLPPHPIITTKATPLSLPPFPLPPPLCLSTDYSSSPSSPRLLLLSLIPSSVSPHLFQSAFLLLERFGARSQSQRDGHLHAVRGKSDGKEKEKDERHLCYEHVRDKCPCV